MSGASLEAHTRREQRLYPRKMSRRIPLERLSAVIVAAVVVLSPAGSAHAHGDIREAAPKAGSRVTEPPQEVVVALAEPAAEGSTLVVTDGCGQEVSGAIAIRRDVVEVPIEGGEPGRWKVSLRSISSVDGHLVKETFSFKVAGRKDCSQEGDGEADEGTDISPDTSSRPPIENPDSGGTSFPIVPFALGTVAVIAVAVAVRGPWNKS